MEAAQVPPDAVIERQVTAEDTAASWGAEFPPAASTPFALGLAEVACHRAVAAELKPEEVTVGTEASIRHLAPSPIGAWLRASARLVSRDGRWLEFVVTIEDAEEVVAEIEHTRAIVDRESMLERLGRA